MDSEQQVQDMMGKLTVEPQPGQVQPLNKKRSHRCTVQRLTQPADVPPVPVGAPAQQQARDFNPVVGSAPAFSPSSSDVLAPSSPNVGAFRAASPGSTPQSSAGLPLLPGQEDTSDEVIPNALVLKNVSFNTSQDEMLLMMDALGLVRPYAFNFHYDMPASPGAPPAFRGLAFANFRMPEDATAALAALNGYEVHGRKLKVEYKRQLRVGEKEKIEREKAIKRMRSAQSLRGERSPDTFPQQQQQQHIPSVPALPHDYALPAHTGAAPLGVPTAYHSGERLSPSGQYAHDANSAFDMQQWPPSAFSSPNVNSSAMLQPRSVSAGQRRPSHSASKMTELDMNDAQTLEIYSRVLLFKDDSLRDELSFSKSLSAHQRRIVHLVAQKLGLGHRSAGEGAERHAVVFKSSAPMAEAEPKQRGSSGLRGKKSMPNMRQAPDFSQIGLPPMGQIGAGAGGNRMLSGRKSQGDLRARSSSGHHTAGAPPLPTPFWLPNNGAGADPPRATSSPTGTSSSSGSVSGFAASQQQQNMSATRPNRSASGSQNNARGNAGRAEQSSDWRRGTLSSAQEQSSPLADQPGVQTAASLEI